MKLMDFNDECLDAVIWPICNNYSLFIMMLPIFVFLVKYKGFLLYDFIRNFLYQYSTIYLTFAMILYKIKTFLLGPNFIIYNF